MSLSKRDKKAVWHPYTSQKSSASTIPIASAKGAYLFDEKGKIIIDAISSWWVNTHGHGHPYIAKQVSAQIKTLDHVIFAGFTHEPAVLLAERLLKHLPETQDKVFYSDNGSTAVEVALKMAVQYFFNKGQTRRKIIAFEHAYHGDTFGAMSVSGKSVFNRPFQHLTFEVDRIVLPLKGAEAKALTALENLLKQGDVAAFIFEPLVLGAAGMMMYDAEPLNKMIALCKSYGAITIADEVMTGFYRTGTLFAAQQLREHADIHCLSKGITGGTLPLGVTACNHKIYNAFVDDDIKKTLFHGHSYTGNPIACAAALAALDLYEKPSCLKNVERIHRKHSLFMKSIMSHPQIADIRLTGTILAIEIKTAEQTSYTNELRDTIIAFFTQKGILIRPLGNVIYILPPYCISNRDLDYIYANIEVFLESL